MGIEFHFYKIQSYNLIKLRHLIPIIYKPVNILHIFQYLYTIKTIFENILFSGVRMLQDLTNTSFVSNTAAKFENKVEDLSSELPNRRRRCTPLSLKEPSLKG